MQGESGGQKVTAHRAYDELKVLRKVNDRLKYSADPENENGDTMTVQQIKSWFSTRAQKGKRRTKMTVLNMSKKLKELDMPTTDSKQSTTNKPSKANELAQHSHYHTAPFPRVGSADPARQMN